MSGPPEVRIVRGAPSAVEEAAVRAAIVKMWREDAASAKPAGDPPWVAAARAAALRVPIADLPGPHAWALSYRFETGPISRRRTGRGDSK